MLHSDDQSSVASQYSKTFFSSRRNFLVRVAVWYYFCLEGIYVGVFSAFLPQMQSLLGLSDSALGSAIIFYYTGQVSAAPIASSLIRKYGCRVSVFIGSILFCAALPFISLSTNFETLCITFLAFGMSLGLIDVSMNSSAILAEVIAGKPIVGVFHGSYSVSVALGGLAGTALSKQFTALQVRKGWSLRAASPYCYRAMPWLVAYWIAFEYHDVR